MMTNERTGPKTAHEIMRETLLAKLRESWNKAELSCEKFNK